MPQVRIITSSSNETSSQVRIITSSTNATSVGGGSSPSGQQNLPNIVKILQASGVGAQGPIGPVGPSGTTGTTGTTGNTGSIGVVGPTGATGPGVTGSVTSPYVPSSAGAVTAESVSGVVTLTQVQYDGIIGGPSGDVVYIISNASADDSVETINGKTGNVKITAGSEIAITQSGNTLTIGSSTSTLPSQRTFSASAPYTYTSSAIAGTATSNGEILHNTSNDSISIYKFDNNGADFRDVLSEASTLGTSGRVGIAFGTSDTERSFYYDSVTYNGTAFNFSTTGIVPGSSAGSGKAIELRVYPDNPTQSASSYFGFPDGTNAVSIVTSFNGETGAVTGVSSVNGQTGDITGQVGPTGNTGSQGPIGNTGNTGAAGAQGTIGNTGAAGAQGTIGNTGNTGAQGTIGNTGAAGAQGPIGNTGADGSVVSYYTNDLINVPGGSTLGITSGTGTVVGLTNGAGYPVYTVGEIGWQRGGETFPVAVGGVAAGISFGTGTAINTILETLLYPYQSVSFSAFDIGLSSGPYEVGQTAGNSTVSSTWSTSGPNANWVATKVSITANQSVGTLASGLNYNSSPHSIAHGAYNFTGETTLTFTITGQQDEGSNATRTDTMNWRYRYLSGKTGDAFNGTGLTGQGFAETLSRTSPSSWSITFSAASPADKAYFIIPTAEYSGTLTFTDTGTGFAFPFTNGGTFDHVNAYGHIVEYNIWKSTNNFAGGTTIRVNT